MIGLVTDLLSAPLGLGVISSCPAKDLSLRPQGAGVQGAGGERGLRFLHHVLNYG